MKDETHPLFGFDDYLTVQYQDQDEQNPFCFVAVGEDRVLSIALVKRLREICDSHLKNLTQEQIDSFHEKVEREEREEMLAYQRREREAKEKGTPTPQQRPTFIYLMRNRRNGLTKIGFSKNPKAREATLQSEEPDIEMLNSWPGVISNEKELHAQFAAQRVRGEWFKLDEVDVSLIEARMTGTGGF